MVGMVVGATRLAPRVPNSRAGGRGAGCAGRSGRGHARPDRLGHPAVRVRAATSSAVSAHGVKNTLLRTLIQRRVPACGARPRVRRLQRRAQHRRARRRWAPAACWSAGRPPRRPADRRHRAGDRRSGRAGRRCARALRPGHVVRGASGSAKRSSASPSSAISFCAFFVSLPNGSSRERRRLLLRVDRPDAGDEAVPGERRRDPQVLGDHPRPVLVVDHPRAVGVRQQQLVERRQEARRAPATSPSGRGASGRS